MDLLNDFPADKHPFRPYTQEKLEALRQDIIERGVTRSLIVRPMGEHRYQIISGTTAGRPSEKPTIPSFPALSAAWMTMRPCSR